MALNRIFIGFFSIAFVVGLLRSILWWMQDQFGLSIGLTMNESDQLVFQTMMKASFDAAETAVGIVIYLIGIMTLWLGIMRIGEKAGAVEKLSKAVAPFFEKLFPDIPKNHPATGNIMMNFAANMLGLDNAATPSGLKAMKDLQELNTEKDTASNSMIMFLVLNTSGLTIIPVSVLALRAAAGSENPTDVFIPILLATYCASIGGIIWVALKQKIKLLDANILKYLGGITGFIALFMYLMLSLAPAEMESTATFMSNFILFAIIIAFIWMGLKKQINIYDSFIEGAKEGFDTTIKIIPYLVGMLVAIAVFRASGTLGFITDSIQYGVIALGMNAEFVDALPTAFMKPLSGSGARAMMVETMDTFGPDSFAGYLSSVFQGSTETTFYTLAVYYGYVNISKTRYTATAGLFADFIGIIAAIGIAYLFYTSH